GARPRWPPGEAPCSCGEPPREGRNGKKNALIHASHLIWHLPCSPRSSLKTRDSQLINSMTAKEVIKLAKDKDIKIVDLKLCDILGTWQHFAIPTSELTEDIFVEGLGF